MTPSFDSSLVPTRSPSPSVTQVRLFVFVGGELCTDLLPCSDAVSTMILLFLRFVVFVFGSEISAQDPDYVTTPFPLPLTSFTCHGRPPGYYADVETGCRTYHLCEGNTQFTYFCPERTLFQQRSRTCDHWHLVRCREGEGLLTGEESLRLATMAEEGQSSEGNPEGIYGFTEESFPAETIQVTSEEEYAESTPPSTETTTTEPLGNAAVNGHPPLKEDYAGQSTKNFLKILLKDLRSLFFIPEFEGNSVVAKSVKEVTLPVEINNLVRFKKRKKSTGLSSPCPTYCNPKYFSGGTCHPCVMIK